MNGSISVGLHIELGVYMGVGVHIAISLQYESCHVIYAKWPFVNGGLCEAFYRLQDLAGVV